MAKQPITGPQDDPDAKFAEQQAQVDALVEAVKGLKPGKGKAAELEAEIAKLNGQLKTYENEKRQWGIEKKAMEKKLAGYSGLEGKYNELEGKYTDAEAENKVLGDRVGELEGENKGLEGRVGELEGENKGLEKDKETCGNRVKNYSKMVDTLIGVLGSLIEQYSDED